MPSYAKKLEKHRFSFKNRCFYGCGRRTRFAFSPQAKIEVETSVCTGFSKCPPDTCSAMGSSPAPYEQRKEKSHPDWDDFFFSGCGGRTRTYDLRVMSPTSFQLLYSAIWALLECLYILTQWGGFVKYLFADTFPLKAPQPTALAIAILQKSNMVCSRG